MKSWAVFKRFLLLLVASYNERTPMSNLQTLFNLKRQGQLADYNTSPNEGFDIPLTAVPGTNPLLTPKLWKRKQKYRTKKIYQLGVDIPTFDEPETCLLYTSPSPRDRQKSRM